jgi:hypothetical protein
MDQRARRAREMQAAIGELLLRDWDPLNVAAEPEAQDEYDGYVGPVYRLLATGASDALIAQHLANVEATTLGYPDTRWKSLLPVAHKLRSLYERLTSSDSHAT